MSGNPPSKAVDPDEFEYELERAEAIDRARSGLLNFTVFTKPDYQVGWHHRALCRKLNDFAAGKIRRLMVFMPPRHGKSELVSRRLPAYIFGRNPNSKIIAASHTADLAASMNRDVQRIIEGPEYRTVFPETSLSGENIKTLAYGSYLRNSGEFEIVGHTGAYKCAGVGGALAGRGGGYLILDDPIKDNEEAESEVYREKLWDWYNTVFETRGEKGAGILITLTRWHEDDVAGRLLKRGKEDPEADQWEVINFAAIKESAEVPGDPREEGEALWSDKFPIEDLKKKRATSGSRVFNAIYQQRPSSEEGELLKRIWLTRPDRRFKTLPELPRGRWDKLLISTDMRFKKDKKTGDYVVHQAWAKLGARGYFLGEHRGRWGFNDSIKEFLKIIARTPVGGFSLKGTDPKYVEDKANGPALENYLEDHVPGIILVEPDGGKVARVHAVTPLWEAGNIWLPDACLYPPIDAIVEEWISFGPGCAFDDRTDTMSQGITKLELEIKNTLRDLVKW